jgi:4,5-DOPA dioxygenase extradiol
MRLNELSKESVFLNGTEKIPLLFYRNGNPMNTIIENEFSAGCRSVVKTLPEPMDYGTKIKAYK